MKTIVDTLKLAGTNLPIKSTIIKIDSSVIIISPLPQIEKYIDQVKEVGEVTDIIAPNTFHYLGVKSAKKLFPNAKVWGVDGHAKKNLDLKFHVLNEKQWPFQAQLQCFSLKGTKSEEVVFYHVSSKTLIVTDLVFNMSKCSGIIERIIFGMFGTYNQFAVSRLFASSISDRKMFSESLKPILNLPIERLIMAHGDDIERNGQQLLVEALNKRRLI